MAIDPINTKPIGPLSSTKPASSSAVEIKGKSPDNTPAVASDDRVVITSTVQNMQNMQNGSSSSSTAPVDEQRIQKVMTALQDGSYTTNPERIAKKMLQFELNLPDTT